MKPLIVLSVFVLFGCTQSVIKPETVYLPLCSLNDDIGYQIFPRSFYDSDGDRIGDLNGITQKLDYLQDLGVTLIWLNPIFTSDLYHNYFDDDFYEIDPEFGTLTDLTNLCTEVHQRGMKILIDMETHYITGYHEWYLDSYQNPDSEYSDYIIYNGIGNTNPESIIWNLTSLPTYDGLTVPVITLNLNHPDVLQYQKDLFAYYLDPDGDGNTDDGVDGYRMDHIMDDLDNKGLCTNLLSGFWKPVVKYCRTVNPEVLFIAEPADWDSMGTDIVSDADMNAAFSIPLMFAIRSMNKTNILNHIRTVFSSVPDGKSVITLLDNHDVDRIASILDERSALKMLYSLLFTLPGMPCLYYGDEIGMTGEKIHNYTHDGNDIPRREAMEWNASVDVSGSALWYKDTEPYWDETFIKDNDGISVEEQKNDTNSLLNHIRRLIQIRNEYSALRNGTFLEIPVDNDEVICFFRGSTESEFDLLVTINLSSNPQSVTINPGDDDKDITQLIDILTGFSLHSDSKKSFRLNLDEYGYHIYKVVHS